LDCLDDSCKKLRKPDTFPVELSEKLSRLQKKTVREVEKREL
jgi:hypothetical protein